MGENPLRSDMITSLVHNFCYWPKEEQKEVNKLFINPNIPTVFDYPFSAQTSNNMILF